MAIYSLATVPNKSVQDEARCWAQLKPKEERKKKRGRRIEEEDRKWKERKGNEKEIGGTAPP